MEFVDAHAHFWDLGANEDWYPGLKDFFPEVYSDYLPDDHRADAAKAGVDVTAVVHVSASSAPRAYLAETGWLDGLHRADPARPAGIIGGLDPLRSPGTLEQDLDAQAAAPAFRGVRMLTGMDPAAEVSARALRLLADRGLVFDQIIRPADADAFVPLLAGAPDLAVVAEHTGWPERDEPFADWRAGMARLAALPNVHCKISGLGMALRTTAVADLRPYVESCLELFGVGRCFFASNFPVDGVGGTYADLLAAYQEITAGLTGAERQALFSANARDRYRLAG
ncbi:amidohydrolase family protein [Actinomadura violacea]|uniref:Amidohydrolase family protein n=1 Tax=Actinomadura violacea TaxID=2819934 RepID=A0ABS3S9U6_9ACTN|nr:amidohydrolase family protein [Actinomadura violacea]MBO2465785.1 amidohydrolase family protein [Actinomadura violacea]